MPRSAYSKIHNYLNENPDYFFLGAALLLFPIIIYLIHSHPDYFENWNILSPGQLFGTLLVFCLVLLCAGIFYYMVGRAFLGGMLTFLMAILGLCGLGIIYLFFNHTIEVVLNKEIKQDPSTYASLILGYTAMGVTIVTIGTGLVGVWIGMRIKEIRSGQEKIQRNLVATAEIALRGLPPFEESQQIPIKCLRPLYEISSIVFDPMDSSIINFLDKLGNGVRLRLARACHLYGKGVYNDAKAILKEALKVTGNNNYGDRKLAIYRLGILERQIGNYQASIDYFSCLGKEAFANRDNAYFQHACVGMAISLLALRNDVIVAAKLDVDYIIQSFVGPILKKVRIDVGSKDYLLEHAYALLNFVYNNNMHHVMASMYLAKVCYISDILQSSLITALPEIGLSAANQTLHYLERLPIHEDLNIEANYEWSRALCCVFLHYYTKNKDYLNKAKKYTERSIRLTKDLFNTHPEIEIYSEESERQVSVEECITHIERLNAAITLMQT